MRRPLFGNGLPRNVLNADSTVTVLDTGALDPDTVYALTLYLWVYQSGPTGGFVANPDVFFEVVTSGGPPGLVAQYSTEFLDTLFSTSSGPPPIAPIKVLDRYMMRGDQQLTARNIEAASTSCFLWGYFEAVGVVPAGEPFRGLQPAAKLTSPFSYVPAGFDLVGVDLSASAVVHKLDPAYADVLDLDVVAAGATGEVAVNYDFNLQFPGGVVVPLPSLDTATQGRFRSRILDGIPMLALDNTDAGSRILINGTTGGGTGANTQARAYGSFRRA